MLQAERPSRCKINDNFGSIMKGNWQLQREGLEQRFQESLQGGNLRYLPGADGKVAWADLRAERCVDPTDMRCRNGAQHR